MPLKLNPFYVENLNEETLIERITELADMYNDDAGSMTELSENVLLLTDIIYLYGELLSRVQKEYSLAKYENNILETKTAYRLKAETTEKYPISYFNSLAQEAILEERKREFELQRKQTELKYAYDATQERINAIKKKIDSMKFEY